MVLIILQLILCALPFTVSLTLYRSRRRCMVKFYERMVRNDKARKVYVQVVLFLLLLFHYLYTSGHPGEFGVLPSTVVCAAMFSFRRTDRWLRMLRDRPRAFAALALAASVIGFVPHLYTTALTAAYLLSASLFYPSVRIMSEWKENDIRRVFRWVEHPETFVESYYDDHYAGLPHGADDGNSDTTAQNHQIQNEYEQ